MPVLKEHAPKEPVIYKELIRWGFNVNSSWAECSDGDLLQILWDQAILTLDDCLMRFIELRGTYASAITGANVLGKEQIHDICLRSATAHNINFLNWAIEKGDLKREEYSMYIAILNKNLQNSTTANKGNALWTSPKLF